MKRAFDLILSAILLLILSPVLLVTASVIRLRLGSPVIFRQQRPGLFGKPFTMFKFRTMTGDTNPDGTPKSDEERLTPLGLFLRRTSLDELPELVNVLRGEMSLVGPRPLLMEYLPLYSPEQSRRHTVRPGITGWAQINGRNAASWDEKFACDLWYVENQSLKVDMKILVASVRKVIAGEGVSEPGQATARPFNGNR